ncbi:MAG: hypothetical protein Q7S56_02625, partial [Nanoarchaeota archaeon]|nr:hypothetical protein [Nanoarchaeota archaeon]
MKNLTKIVIAVFIIAMYFVSLIALGSAMTLYSVSADNIQPGSEKDISVKIKNTLDDDAKDVSLSLILTKLPFAASGSAEDNTDQIDSGDIETFNFKIKALNDVKAGSYEIPYHLIYKTNNTVQTKDGTFSLTVEANPELYYSASAENPIVGSQGKIKLTIVNKGFGDAKFTSVKLTPEGYTLLSEDNQYIGTIASDDSETLSFDTIFKKENPILNAQIEYKDFNNQ